MKRLILIFLACAVCQLATYAQSDSTEVSYRLCGFMTDAQTGEPVMFATVLGCDGLILGQSDKDGFYCLDLPTGPVKLQFAALGYKSHDAEVNLDHDVVMNIALKEDAIIENFHFKRWEIDWKAFNCYGFSNMYDGAMTSFGVEGRYDIWNTPLEVGLGASYAVPLNMNIQDAYTYWTVYASLDCELQRLGFVIFKGWTAPYVGVAVGGGQSYYTDRQNIANVALRAGIDVRKFRIFFEQHFNTDKTRASFFGLTYYF